ILAKSYPLIETNFEVRERLYMPGLVICGPNINVQPKCYLGLTGTKGTECDNRWWAQRPIEEFKFIFPDTIGEALGGYEVTVNRERLHFTIYDLLPTIGGFIGMLFLIYRLLWGDNRLNPFGIFQKHIFRSIPSISFNHFGNGYGLYNNAIVLDRIEKPQSAAIKTRLKQMCDDDSDHIHKTSYPFKGFGPEQLDEMRWSLLESGANPGTGGNVNQTTNSDQLKDNSNIVEIENIRKEVDQLRQELLELRNLLPLGPGTVYIPQNLTVQQATHCQPGGMWGVITIGNTSSSSPGQPGGGATGASGPASTNPPKSLGTKNVTSNFAMIFIAVFTCILTLWSGILV
ncbi:5195_t:CDS:2, partial [Racocetra fulgida]